MKIKIKKNYLYVLVSLLCILFSLIFVNAFLPIEKGHTLDELQYYGNISGVPEGFCVFSASGEECPIGFSTPDIFDGRTIRVDSDNLGGVGGSDTHTHGVSLTDAKAACYDVKVMGSGFQSQSASSWSPYTNVLICCKDLE